MADKTGYDMFVIEQYLKAKIHFPREHHPTLMIRLREHYCPLLWVREENMSHYMELATKANTTQIALAPILDSINRLKLIDVDPNDRYEKIELVDNDVPDNFFYSLEEDDKKNIPKLQMDDDDQKSEIGSGSMPGSPSVEDIVDLKPNIEELNIESNISN
ncbi:uncharacterized protein [Lepeophtheirus salmonis]|uniref:uncharacterized protein n=1 Tax=Lepeophtheirus salmonis TaxID=72036 RepID=UPI001AE39147|nr:uncharacterized protein LOC121123086 [Lepeophtheirus salmonis]